jgi:GntR family transcriptional regulator
VRGVSTVETRNERPGVGEAGGPPGYVYEWLAQELAFRIESGELAPHTPLPSECRLAHEYGVSLGSARHATRLLRERGYVVTVRSKGTYVAKREA